MCRLDRFDRGTAPALGLGLCILLYLGLVSPRVALGGQQEVPTTDRASVLEPLLPPPPLPDIETFMQIGYASSPAISPDGRTLFFTAGMSGANQIYRLTSEGWPYQLTFFEDGIDYVVYSPERDFAVVGVGAGGDERYQLYLLNGRTGELRPLTAKPEVRHTSPVWSRDGRRLFYSANEEDASSFYIYEMNLVTGRSRKLITREGQNSVQDVSMDDSRIVFSSSTSSLNNDLYLFELAGGHTELLTPHQGEHLYGSAKFAADGRAVYLLTDDHPLGLTTLVRLELTSKRLQPFLDSDSKWEVESYALSRDARFLAWVVNEDGYGKLRLWDLERSRELPGPELEGIASAPDIASGGWATFVFNSGTRIPDIWVWEFSEAAGLASGETKGEASPRLATPATDGTRPATWGRTGKPDGENLRQATFSTHAGVDPSLFREPILIRYPSFDGTDIPAFLYLPPTYREGEPVPFILDVHGGPEQQSRPAFNRHFTYLMQHGFGLLAPNFRGSSGYGRPFRDADNYKKRLDAVKDVAYGAQWLIDHGYARPGLIGIKGASYGGYMTLAAMTEYPELFSAGLDEVGIANFVSFLEQTAGYRRTLRESEYGPLSDRSFLESISPLHKAGQIRGALLVVHGANDPRVPVGEARQILAAAKANGTPVDSLIFADEGHGVSKRENRLVLYRKMADFFIQHLSPGPKPVTPENQAESPTKVGSSG